MPEYNNIFFWYSYVIRVTILEMNGIATHNEWPRSLPVLSRSQGAAYSRRDGEERASQQTVPSFVVAFSGDQVTISSKRSDTSSQGDELPARMPASEAAGQAGLPDIRSAAATAGVSLSSESIQGTRSFGPYEIQINRYAMKRYGEASSFRGSQTSTFEITA